jgi:hypothetical protein
MEGTTMNEWLEAHNQEELDALIKQHGEGLRVRVVGEWGDVRITCCALNSIDLSGAHILGTVYSAKARITGTVYAEGVSIGGSLVIIGARIALDAYLAAVDIGGSLEAARADIGASVIVDRARIGGSLNLARARIGGSISAAHANIGGALDASGAHIGSALNYLYGLIRGGILMPDVMHGVRGVAIAQCDGFILWQGEDGRYYAGCHGPLTRNKALRHWGAHRHDERARVFSAAILANREAIAG